MVITQRLCLFASALGFCVLLSIGYIVIKDYYKIHQFLAVPLNGSKILVGSSKSVVEKTDKDHWHEKLKEKLPTSTNLGFIHAFLAAISVIVVSELGDKTFFIAAIMAMRHSRLIIYSGAMGALGAMTILSALLGNIVTKFIPRIYTYYLSSVLFAGFGLKMLKDGYVMSADEGTEEYKEVQQELEQVEAKNEIESVGQTSSMANEQRMTTKVVTCIRQYLSPIFVQAFILTFLAEWGDRSQITTIVLAASENLLGVIIGGTIGHGLCTGLAVIGGRFVAQRISPKTVTLVGGVVFLCFALSAIFIRPDQ